MVISRSPSATLSGDKRSLPSSDASEDRANRHAEPRQISLSYHVPGHDFSGRENVLEALDLRALIYPHSQISERNAGPQRIAVERRRVDAQRPVRFWRR